MRKLEAEVERVVNVGLSLDTPGERERHLLQHYVVAPDGARDVMFAELAWRASQRPVLTIPAESKPARTADSLVTLIGEAHQLPPVVLDRIAAAHRSSVAQRLWSGALRGLKRLLTPIQIKVEVERQFSTGEPESRRQEASADRQGHS